MIRAAQARISEDSPRSSHGPPGGRKRGGGHPHLIVTTTRRLGVCPTGIVAMTLLVRVSIAETVLEVELLTKRRSPLGWTAIQLGSLPTSIFASCLSSGTEKANTALPGRLVTYNSRSSGVSANPWV